MIGNCSDNFLWGTDLPFEGARPVRRPMGLHGAKGH